MIARLLFVMTLIGFSAHASADKVACRSLNQDYLITVDFQLNQSELKLVATDSPDGPLISDVSVYSCREGSDENNKPDGNYICVNPAAGSQDAVLFAYYRSSGSGLIKRANTGKKDGTRLLCN